MRFREAIIEKGKDKVCVVYGYITLLRPFPVLGWLLKGTPRRYSRLLRESFKNNFLLYACYVLLRGYDGVVVYRYAVYSSADKELCEVWQI